MVRSAAPPPAQTERKMACQAITDKFSMLHFESSEVTINQTQCDKLRLTANKTEHRNYAQNVHQSEAMITKITDNQLY